MDEISRAAGRTVEADGVPEDPDAPAVGRWYWVSYDDGKLLMCVTHIGSNYALVEGPLGHSERVHLDEWSTRSRHAESAARYIAAKVQEYREETGRLMAAVESKTRALAVSFGPKQFGEGETAALATRAAVGQPVEEYKEALVRAKTVELPELFKAIERSNELMARWMKAETIPMVAQAARLRGSIGAINDRISAVELYAGLVEESAKVRDGRPAPADAPVHLLQRRHYMDEECLVAYEAGGMNFRDVAAFDEWLSRPENLDRVLPHPRCVVAFQVRRKDKDYGVGGMSISQFIRFTYEGWSKLDKLTFLYLRNGEQLHRVQTAVDFDAKLFPDFDAQKLLTGQLYATNDGDKVITEHEYLGMVEDEAKRRAEAEAKYAAEQVAYAAKLTEYQAAKAAWEARLSELEAAEEAASAGDTVVQLGDGAVETTYCPAHSTAKYERMEHERSHPREPREPWLSVDHFPRSKKFKPWNRSNVHYDDVSEAVRRRMDHHNRLVVVLQGLLDRSLAFHPHPPYHLWEQADFERAIRLVYDDSRALTPGPPPDFEAYRARLNGALRVGSVTVGQQDYWLRREGEKESKRRQGLWIYRNDREDLEKFHPEGDPGPGTLARVETIGKGGATYRWQRSRRGELTREEIYWEKKSHRDKFNRTVRVPVGEVLNVSAYRPGDFRQFYADPRTRAEYLEWAPLLLVAEDYHAGKRKVQGEGDE